MFPDATLAYTLFHEGVLFDPPERQEKVVTAFSAASHVSPQEGQRFLEELGALQRNLSASPAFTDPESYHERAQEIFAGLTHLKIIPSDLPQSRVELFAVARKINWMLFALELAGSGEAINGERAIRFMHRLNDCRSAEDYRLLIAQHISDYLRYAAVRRQQDPLLDDAVENRLRALSLLRFYPLIQIHENKSPRLVREFARPESGRFSVHESEEGGKVYVTHAPGNTAPLRVNDLRRDYSAFCEQFFAGQPPPGHEKFPDIVIHRDGPRRADLQNTFRFSDPLVPLHHQVMPRFLPPVAGLR